MTIESTTRECCRCEGVGGEPGANFGDRGWHPCYHCCESGSCQCSDADIAAVAAAEAEWWAAEQAALLSEYGDPGGEDYDFEPAMAAPATDEKGA